MERVRIISLTERRARMQYGTLESLGTRSLVAGEGLSKAVKVLLRTS